VKDDLTASENLKVWAAMAALSVGAEDLAQGAAVAEDRALRPLAGGPAVAGAKRRIGLARLTLARQARLWILDEPFNALDRHGVGILNRLIERHVSGGGAVVLTTHQSWEAPVPVVRLDLVTEAGS